MKHKHKPNMNKRIYRNRCRHLYTHLRDYNSSLKKLFTLFPCTVSV